MFDRQRHEQMRRDMQAAAEEQAIAKALGLREPDAGRGLTLHSDGELSALVFRDADGKLMATQMPFTLKNENRLENRRPATPASGNAPTLADGASLIGEGS